MLLPEDHSEEKREEEEGEDGEGGDEGEEEFSEAKRCAGVTRWGGLAVSWMEFSGCVLVNR